MKENTIAGKSKAFALRTIRMYQHLCKEKQEYVMPKQILRSGTSIGANVREAQRGQSKPDFYSKMNIALKEAEETAYWIELLHESKYLTEKEFCSIYADITEIISLLVSITKTQNKTAH